MKTIYKTIIAFVALGTFTACDDYKMFEKELYEKQIYFVSDDNLVFPIEYALDGDKSLGHFSIAYGGTTGLDGDVNVTFDIDLAVLDKYNYSNFDIDVAKYAKKLADDKFLIPNKSVVLKASDKNPYVAVPLEINPSNLEGLSPDSTYIIPLRIAEVSNYKVNPKKETLLCRIYFKNRFASVKTETPYGSKGYQQEEGKSESSLSIRKVVHPISKNAIRLFAGINPYAMDLAKINRFGLRVDVSEDNTLKLSAQNSATMEVEQLAPLAEPEFAYKNTYNKTTQTFSLYYKFRYLSDKNVWSKWYTVRENVTRLIDVD